MQVLILMMLLFSVLILILTSHIETVLSRLQQAGLTVKASKCQWMQGKVMYLGHLIGQGEIQTLQAKVQSINCLLYTSPSPRD